MKYYFVCPLVNVCVVPYSTFFNALKNGVFHIHNNLVGLLSAPQYIERNILYSGFIILWAEIKLTQPRRPEKDSHCCLSVIVRQFYQNGLLRFSLCVANVFFLSLSRPAVPSKKRSRKLFYRSRHAKYIISLAAVADGKSVSPLTYSFIQMLGRRNLFLLDDAELLSCWCFL